MKALARKKNYLGALARCFLSLLTKQNKTSKAFKTKKMADVLALAAAAAAAHPLVAALLSSLALVSCWRNSARESARERETRVEKEIEQAKKARKQLLICFEPRPAASSFARLPFSRSLWMRRDYGAA